MPSFGAIGHSAIVMHFVRIAFHNLRRFFGDACTLRTRSFGSRQCRPFWTLLPFVSFLSFGFTFEFSLCHILATFVILATLLIFATFRKFWLITFLEFWLATFCSIRLPTFVIALSFAFLLLERFLTSNCRCRQYRVGLPLLKEVGGTCALNFGNPAD